MRLNCIVCLPVLLLVCSVAEGKSEDKEQKEDKRKELSMGRYVGGGVATIFLGGGIGHAVQGRWHDGGWPHTVMQIGGAFVYGFGRGFTKGYLRSNPEATRKEINEMKTFEYVLASVGLVLLASSRITEIITVWFINEDKYKLVNAPKKQASSYALLPHVHQDGTMGMQLALSIPIN